MNDTMYYLDLTKSAISDIGNIAPDIAEIIKRGDEQADTRKGAIQTINEMCDALQLACDLISKELSASITEFNRIRNDKPEILIGYFQRTSLKFSEPSLRLLLHEGRVCGELHALGDRFTQPFSDVTTGAVSIWENVKTFFTRSNSMVEALGGLLEGEMNYLHDFGGFLNDVRNGAENATGIYSEEQLRQAGDTLVELMRQKRQTLQNQVREIRIAADACIGNLH
jgi:hypothetical protein